MLLATPAEPPNWAEMVSAVGTLAAAIFAVVAIVVTVRGAKRDRGQAETRRQEDLANAARDRAEADQRLREERDAADRRLMAELTAAEERLRDERADWDRRQVRDWQAAAAIRLLDRIANLHPHLAAVAHPVPRMAPTQLQLARGDAMEALQQGAYTDALALGDANGTTLYRTLVSFVMSIQPAIRDLGAAPQPDNDPDFLSGAAEIAALNARRYSRYVRLWLCQLIETGSIPASAVGSPNSVDSPSLGGLSARVIWTPVEAPPGWWEDTRTDPGDPAFTLHR